MTRNISGNFDIHRVEHPARAPDLANKKFADELTPISENEGLFEMTYPASGSLTFDHALSPENKYLWVVGGDYVRASIEFSSHASHFGRGRLSHTNITGGADAHTAGEIWFRDPETVIINGGSSRYTPRSAVELQSAADAFHTAGFRTASMGWDEESGTPARILRGSPQWIK